jgi:hypothetical protein
MRGALSMVSLLFVVAIAAYFYSTSSPELQQPEQYQKLQSKVDTAVQQLKHDPQADFDAANRASSSSTNTPNTPPPGN